MMMSLIRITVSSMKTFLPGVYTSPIICLAFSPSRYIDINHILIPF